MVIFDFITNDPSGAFPRFIRSHNPTGVRLTQMLPPKSLFVLKHLRLNTLLNYYLTVLSSPNIGI